MDWTGLVPTTEVLANIAQIISAIAVIISLLYVGYQIKQNTGEIRSANRQQLLSRSMSVTLAFGAPEWSRIITMLRTGGTLSAAEMTQAEYIVRTVLYDVQEGFWLHKEKRLDDAYWKTRSQMILSYLETAIARDIYRRDKSIGVLDRDFVQWLDGALKQRLSE